MLEPEPSSGASSTPPVPARQPQGLFEKIFLNDQELRTIWRVLLYGLFWITFSFGLDLAAIELFGFTANPISAQRVLREDLLSFLAAFGAALAMAKLERRPVDVYGFPRERALGRILVPGLRAIHFGTRGWILAGGDFPFHFVWRWTSPESRRELRGSRGGGRHRASLRFHFAKDWQPLAGRGMACDL